MLKLLAMIRFPFSYCARCKKLVTKREAVHKQPLFTNKVGCALTYKELMKNI